MTSSIADIIHGNRPSVPPLSETPPQALGVRGRVGADPARVLLQQLQHRLRRAVRLGEHRRAGLLEDLQLRERRHLGRHVDVLDRALGGLEVLLVGREVVQRVLEAVLHRAEEAPRLRHVVDRGVDRRQARPCPEKVKRAESTS